MSNRGYLYPRQQPKLSMFFFSQPELNAIYLSLKVATILLLGYFHANNSGASNC